MKLPYIVFISCALIILSCKKTLEIPAPPDRIISAEVFTTDAKAASAMSGVYGNMINGPQGFSNYLITLYGGLAADEMKRFNPATVYLEFMNNKLTTGNAQVKNIWATAYKTIYYVNAILEGLARSTSISPNLSRQLAAECKFVRSFTYFYLVNLYGDAPLVLSTDYTANAIIARTPASTVYSSIVTDLIDASIDLPVAFSNNDKGRPTKWAAKALLARVYLYIKDWNNTSALATEVISSGLFTPLPALSSVFLKNNKEAIWQLAPTSGVLPETSQMQPSGSSPQIYLTPQLLTAFEQGDDRRQKWIDSITVQSTKYYYPAKYRNTVTTVNEYYTLLRAAEMYLVRAEAKAQLNDLTAALSDLNSIRARAGLSNITSTDKTFVLNAIAQENRVEFFAEWAHRWFDLKKSGDIDNVLSTIKPGWQHSSLLFPIPQDEILTNHNLVQNPGY